MGSMPQAVEDEHGGDGKEAKRVSPSISRPSAPLLYIFGLLLINAPQGIARKRMRGQQLVQFGLYRLGVACSAR